MWCYGGHTVAVPAYLKYSFCPEQEAAMAETGVSRCVRGETGAERTCLCSLGLTD